MPRCPSREKRVLPLIPFEKFLLKSLSALFFGFEKFLIKGVQLAEIMEKAGIKGWLTRILG